MVQSLNSIHDPIIEYYDVPNIHAWDSNNYFVAFFLFLFFSFFIWTTDSPEPPTLSIPENMNSGKRVTTTCSVFHSCPSDPPNLTWSHKGTLSSQSLQQTNGQWKITSSLTFTPSRTDHKKALNCTAEFLGGMKSLSMKKLEVKCKWKNFSRIL